MKPGLVLRPLQRRMRARGPLEERGARQKALGLGGRWAVDSSSNQALKVGRGSSGRVSGSGLGAVRSSARVGGRSGMGEGRGSQKSEVDTGKRAHQLMSTSAKATGAPAIWGVSAVV